MLVISISGYIYETKLFGFESKIVSKCRFKIVLIFERLTIESGLFIYLQSMIKKLKKNKKQHLVKFHRNLLV